MATHYESTGGGAERHRGHTSDFLLVGCRDTDDEAEADHDRNLKVFLERARKRNLRLNADKLKMTQVPYIEHLLTREGLRVDPKKAEAIEKMPAPKDAKAVQRLLGSVNYLAKFVPHLSNIMQPLRQLLDKQAFDEMKKALTMNPALEYYDVMKLVVIQCDASDGELLFSPVKSLISKSTAEIRCTYRVITNTWK